MVYHYRTVNCPNCGRVADRTRTVDSQELKGSPFRVCRHCDTVYFDPDYKEVAITIFKDKGGNPNIWSYLWLIISNVVAIYTLVEAAKEGFRDLGNAWIGILLALGFAAVFDVGFIRVIRNRIHANEYHQKSLDLLEGRTEELTGELAASMERMSNRAYLNALKAHGVDVPDYFFERLNGKEANDFTIPVNIATIDNSTVQQTTEEVEETDDHAVSKEEAIEERSVSIDVAFCRKCGAKIPADSAFCPKCGEKVIDI